MKSLAGNRLYAWDHNTDYVSTFQNQTSKKKKKEEEEEKRKKKGRKNVGKGNKPLKSVFRLRVVLSKQKEKKKEREKKKKKEKTRRKRIIS
jgi:hypothetical protein